MTNDFTNLMAAKGYGIQPTFPNSFKFSSALILVKKKGNFGSSVMMDAFIFIFFSFPPLRCTAAFISPHAMMTRILL
uniref:Aldehyde dehydrogenase 22A1-like n=1 Tax=Rhizophora mucronata TaxID=61149 RepID=A0A2P2MR67_RHIMU